MSAAKSRMTPPERQGGLPGRCTAPYKGNGLLPAIVQDADSGAVLMLDYMDEAALRTTFDRGRVVFFTRSRKRLWQKSETFRRCA